MHFTISIGVLMVGVCLTPRVHAQPDPQADEAIDLNSIFEIAQGGYGECGADYTERMAAQLPNMQEAFRLAAEQVPNEHTVTDPRTSPLLRLEFANTFPSAKYPDVRSRGFISKTIAIGSEHLTVPRPSFSFKWRDGINRRIFLLCDSIGVLLKHHDDLVPWTNTGAPTIGALYSHDPHDQAEYWYFYVPLAQAIGRVPKEILPTIPDGQPFAGKPFSAYPPPVDRKFGPTFCSNRTSQSWGFKLTSFPGADARTMKAQRGIVVLCPRSFEQKRYKHPRELLPNAIDASAQAVGTHLEYMKPAWFSWACAILQVARLLHRFPLYLRPASVKLEPRPDDNKGGSHAPLSEKDQFRSVDRPATTALECSFLAFWQLASPRSKVVKPTGWSSMPSLYNPPNNVWFVIAVYLQQVSYPPQDWGLGVAQDTQQLDPPCNEGGGDYGGGGGRGGGGGGDGGASRKRPRPDEGGDSGGGKRPRIAARKRRRRRRRR